MAPAIDDSATAAFVSQAEFSRHRRVSRKTVTLWKRAGKLVTDDRGLVDVRRSDAMLNQRPPVIRGGVTSARVG